MIKNFDLSGWTCFSERRNSKSYMSPDKKWMVKKNHPFFIINIWILQKNNIHLRCYLMIMLHP